MCFIVPVLTPSEWVYAVYVSRYIFSAEPARRSSDLVPMDWRPSVSVPSGVIGGQEGVLILLPHSDVNLRYLLFLIEWRSTSALVLITASTR